MTTQVELGQPVLGELGCAVLIGRLGDVVKLVFDQGAELSVGTLGTVVRSQGDKEVGLLTEPLPHLLLLAGFLPSAGAEHQLLGLA
ncbi:hypothetical protein D3C78_933720 [compost metagenome]